MLHLIAKIVTYNISATNVTYIMWYGRSRTTLYIISDYTPRLAKTLRSFLKQRISLADIPCQTQYSCSKVNSF